MLALILACLSVLGRMYCFNIPTQSRASPHFLLGTALGHVSHPDQTSGLCASRVHPNILYAHNDKGDGPKLYAISALTGEQKKTIHIYGAHNHDWEDIACGPCDGSGGHCIYIGDIGDHSGDGARNIIYKIREPAVMDLMGGDITVDVEAQLRFIWNPPQQDSETLMVDPQGNVYVISKVANGKGQVGMIDSSAWENSTIAVVANLTTLPLSTGNEDPSGGDISLDGNEILIQTHHQVFYWQRTPGSSVRDTLMQNPISVPFHYNKHVDSVAWDAQGRGYYTLSEEEHDKLYYYARQ
ncbi:uncharacterized protein LOC117314787 [Pecten maximus]|uniref:uncharacterized protein LOC117314787 n=1 Tax=Pecten maximus TaxID=6579 RepID=UPI001458F343|nr:uncharacterized protein LOC117314787 [Pecten maximus]